MERIWAEGYLTMESLDGIRKQEFSYEHEYINGNPALGRSRDRCLRGFM
jgi:hypothetical protein